MSLMTLIKQKIKGNRMGRLAKTQRHAGKSVRNGNAPSPYSKYHKVPYKYSFDSKKVVFFDTEKDKRQQQKDDYDRKRRNKNRAA